MTKPVEWTWTIHDCEGDKPRATREEAVKWAEAFADHRGLDKKDIQIFSHEIALEHVFLPSCDIEGAANEYYSTKRGNWDWTLLIKDWGWNAVKAAMEHVKWCDDTTSYETYKSFEKWRRRKSERRWRYPEMFRADDPFWDS